MVVGRLGISEATHVFERHAEIVEELGDLQALSSETARCVTERSRECPLGVGISAASAMHRPDSAKGSSQKLVPVAARGRCLGQGERLTGQAFRFGDPSAIRGIHRGRRETLDIAGGRHVHDRVHELRFCIHAA